MQNLWNLNIKLSEYKQTNKQTHTHTHKQTNKQTNKLVKVKI